MKEFVDTYDVVSLPGSFQSLPVYSIAGLKSVQVALTENSTIL